MKKENIVPLSNDLNGTLYIKKDNFQVFYEYLSKDFPKCQEILDKYEKYMIDKALICKQFGKVNFFTFTWKEVYPYDGKFFVPTNIELLYSVPEYFMKRERKINGNEILYISEFVNHLFLFFQCYDIPIKSIPLSSLYIDQFTGAIKINLLTLSLHSKRQNINYEDIFCAFLFDLLDFKRQIDQKLEVNSETSKHPKIESKVNICIFSHVYQQETNIQVDSIQKIRNFIGNIHSKEYKQYKIYKKSILEYVSSMSNQCFSSYQPLKPNSYFLLLHCIINEKREVSPSFIINGLKIYWKQCNNSKIQYSNVFDTFIQFLLEKGYLSDQNGDIDRCLSIILEQKKHFLLRYLTSLIMDNIHCQFQDQIIMKKDPSWHLIYQGDAKYLISNSNNEIFFWEKRITKDTSSLFHRKKSTTPKFLFNIITDNHSFEYTSFFPGGDLYNYICKNKYSITTSDKIVFLLEILEALHYVSQEYKGYVSLSDKCFLVNEKKDVYLAKVDFDKRTVLSRTYPENTKYYLHPTSIKCSGYSIDIITPEQICIDHILYFFGVLMFYIVTLIHPMELLNDKDCMSVYNLMRTWKYIPKEFSKSKEGDGILHMMFIDDEFDEFIHVFSTCFSRNITSLGDQPFLYLINMIHNTKIYTLHENEINFRLSTAINGNEYRCTFKTLAVAQMNFIVNSTIYYVIKDFAHKNEYYRYIPTQNNLLNNHNIMDYYMSAFFNLKNKLKRLCTEKFSFLNRIIPINMQFPMFNYQIQHCQTSNRLILSVIDNFRKDTIYITNISQKAHSTSFSNQYILERLPIMKLTTFLYYFSEIPIFIKVSWIYEIFTELIGLHSYGNVHGNLSLDQIFICYNIYNNYVDVTLLPFPKSHYFNTKNKMKDISDFGKVIYSLFFNHHQSTNHVNERISQLIDFCHNNPSNIFDINHQIHEIIDQSHEKQQIHKFIKQSLIQIPFSLYYIFQIDSFFKNFLQNHRSQVDDIFYWNFQRMISNVNEYINNRIDRKIKTHKNHSYPLVSSPNEIITKLERLCQQEIKKYRKMHTLEKERYKNQINELIFPANFFPHTNYDSYSKVKINSVSKKLNSLSNQIPRTFMLSCLQKKTIDFFIRRYLFQLNPRNSYKIFTIILNTVSRYQNQPIFSDDIKKLCDSLNVKYEVENGRVIMYR